MGTDNTAQTQVNYRVDTEIKARAESILAQLGLSTSDFNRMALHQLVLRQGLPFEVNIPNAETQVAIKESVDGQPRFSEATQLFDHLDGTADDR